MHTLFEETTIGGMVLKNRFVRSATWEGLAAGDGASTPALEALLADLAAGGVGLVIPGYAYVSREGQDEAGQLGASSDEHLPGLSRMADAVHAAGAAIALQLAHGGVYSSPALTGLEAVGPSPLHTDDGPLGRAMTAAELAAVPAAFAAAAARAQAAGFDAVQVHAAHGYLLSQYLSPYFNRRDDGYGGAVAQRARLLLEVVAAVRAAVGAGYPLLAKINAADFLPGGTGTGAATGAGGAADGGFSTGDMLQVACLLEAAGVDAVELSGGTAIESGLSFSRLGKPKAGEPEAYYEDAARQFKSKVGMPLMLVGGIRTFDTAERLVTEGATDYVALSRPLIREPHLIARWQAGDAAPASCIRDNGCFDAPEEGHGVFCMVDARKARRAAGRGAETEGSGE